jgi:pyrroloquinoline quinone biosynthesis protein B
MISMILALALATTPCRTELIVLGTSQDAGTPQIGNPRDPAWQDPSLRATASSLALVDHKTGKRYLFDATPDLREQLHWLDLHDPGSHADIALDGIFLTHAHIGHYAGLMFLGRESADTKGIPVYAMPRMRSFLTDNGPWSQLVKLSNITIMPIDDNVATTLGDGVSVTPHRVPHRDEYSETVGFVIAGTSASALYLPDIDSWDLWESRMGIRIEDMIAKVDIAFIDATFFDNAELPAAFARAIPHPRVTESIARFASLPARMRARIRFIHLNHTNPARFATSAARRQVEQSGAKVAYLGERFCLSNR